MQYIIETGPATPSRPDARTARAYWAATSALLAGALAGVPLALAAAIALTALQCVHFRLAGHRPRGLPLQVRAGFLALLCAGLWPPLSFLHLVQAVGVTANVLCGYCLLARLLSLAPWNRREPLSRELLRWTLLVPPGPGSILDRRARLVPR